MTALALQTSSCLPAVDLSAYVPLADAARRIGVNADHLGRRCKVELEGVRLAKLDTPSGGGRPCWFVRESYIQSRIAGTTPAADKLPGTVGLTLKQRNGMFQRWACVRRLRDEQAKPLSLIQIDRLVSQLRAEFPAIRISRSLLYRWNRTAKTAADAIALADTRGGEQVQSSSPDAWAAFADYFLHQNRPTVRHVWKLVKALAAKNDWKWPSYGAVSRQLPKRIPIEVQAANRQPGKYRKQLAPYIAQDAESWRAGELWIGDHKQLDLICSWRDTLIRPWLTAWIDWRTRKVVGHVLSDCPNSSTILAALRSGIKDPSNFGGPAQVKIDNGKDFDSYALHGRTKRMRRSRVAPRIDEARAHGIFPLLKISASFGTRFSPNSKSRIERLFGDTGSFCKEFPTYTGNSVETKPECLNKILANLGDVPTFETVRDRLAAFLCDHNANTDHQIDDLIEAGRRLSPADAFARWCDTRRVLADPEALDLLLMQWSKPVTVGRNGIAVAHSGRALHYGQFAPELSPFKALRKADRPLLNVSYDPDDLRSIHVYDEKYRHVCIARMNVIGGKLSKEDLASVCRAKANYARGLRHIAEYSLTSVMSTEEQLADAAAQRRADERQRQAATAAPAPSRMKIVATPLDGQAKRIEREKLRDTFGHGSPDAPPVDPWELLKNMPPRPRPQWEIDAERGAQLAKEAMA